MSIPDPCWQKVVRYIGIEQELIAFKKKRDWRFERARADINRCWKAARACLLTASFKTYLGKITFLRTYLKHTRAVHLTKEMKHRMLLAELRVRFKREHSSIEDQKRVKAIYCLRYCEYLSSHARQNFIVTPSKTFFDLMTMRANQFYKN